VVQYILNVDLLLGVFSREGFEDCRVDASGVQVEDFVRVDVVLFSLSAAEEESRLAESRRQIVV
jgi:hypothetical protein